MQIRIAWALAIVLLCVGSPVDAQDNVSWWRQMFGEGKAAKEAAVESTAEPLDDLPEHQEVGKESALGSEDETPLDQAVDVPFKEIPWGSVSWDVPVEIEALESLHAPAEAIRIPGFRVQLFMGRLDSARSLRQHLATKLNIGYEIHLTPYPPIFGVQVGDFRTPLAAHRAKKALKRKFPSALVVPAELPLEVAFPVVADCIRTP